MDTDWIKPNTICVDRRFNEYTILVLARDVQTEDMLVIYTQNFGEKETLSCPLDAFFVSFKPLDEHESKVTVTAKTKKTSEDRMTMFFETENFDEKVRLLKELHVMGELTDNIIDNLAATLDVVIDKGDLNTRYEQLRICVETRARFDSGRLRTSFFPKRNITNK